MTDTATTSAPRRKKRKTARPAWPCVERALSGIKPYEGNPRKNDAAVDAVARSIEAFGFRQPIVVDTSGVIVVGHTRWRAAKQLGLTTVPVHVARDMTAEQIRAYRIADNRTAETAEWDRDLLEVELRELKGGDFDLDLLGFTQMELRRALKVPRHTPPDDIPDAAPRAKLGDVWRCGDHRVLCGDCTDAAAVAAFVGSCDLVVTSPPYNYDMEYAGHDDAMEGDAYLALIKGAVESCAAVIHLGCFVAWNIGIAKPARHFEHARLLEAAGLTYERQIVWHKNGGTFPQWYNTKNARGYFPDHTHELIYLFTNGAPIQGGPCDVCDDFSTDVWKINQTQATADLPSIGIRKEGKSLTDGPKKLAAHPAVYPIAIPDGLIRHLTVPGERVFDPFLGAGTTLIAAEQLGRTCFGMDIEPAYVDIAIERWERFTGEKAVMDGATNPVNVGTLGP